MTTRLRGLEQIPHVPTTGNRETDLWLAKLVRSINSNNRLINEVILPYVEACCLSLIGGDEVTISGVDGQTRIHVPFEQGVLDYNYVGATAVPPASGEIRLNDADPNFATAMYVSEFTASGDDYKAVLQSIVPGDYLVFQQQDPSDRSFTFIVSAVTNQTGYVEFTIAPELGKGPVAIGPVRLGALTTGSAPNQVGGITPYMHWNGNWVQGSDYYTSDVVLDGDWLMVANKPTATRPAPQPTGEPAWFSGLGDAPAWSAQSANTTEVISGQRYTISASRFVRGYRIWIPTIDPNYEYTLVTVDEPNGSNPSANLQPLSPIATGWNEFPANDIAPAGTEVDAFLITRNHTGSSTFASDWNYQQPQQPGTPSAGQILHSVRAEEYLRVHKIDDNTVNQAANLATVSPGDTITVSGFVWTVTYSTEETTYYEFGVTPQARAPVSGVNSFSFEVFAPQPTDYVEIVNHYSGNAEVQGIFSTTGYANVAVDQNAYGVDVYLQDAHVSSDWDLMAYTPLRSTNRVGEL